MSTFFSAQIKSLRTRASQVGFTMIELLIVIAILGILAVAVLSAINPVEQINRGRDTGSRSDAEQLLNAVDRYNAFQGYYPWQTGVQDLNLQVDWEQVDNQWMDNGTTPPCPVYEKLSTATTNGCTGSDELKGTFFTRIFNNTASNALYIVNDGGQGDSTYVCFTPRSKAFITEAKARCVDANGSGMPADLASNATAIAAICGDWANDNVMTCLP